MRRAALTTLVVVGGGPTGLETAGALYELYKHVLADEYCSPGKDLRGRVILIEMLDHLLDPYPERLQKAAYRQLENLGVEVILGTRVEHVEPDRVVLADGRVIPTYTLIWSAGVKASPLAEMLGVELARGGRVPVRPTMQLLDDDDVYVVGDMAYLEDPDGQPYPMLIPVAKQQGKLAAKNILRQQKGAALETFRYHDRGIMATIGRSRAVAWIYYKIPLTGFIAWLAWLGLHLITLLGFRNRLNVFINWVWNYLTWDRSVPPDPGAPAARAVWGRRACPDVDEATGPQEGDGRPHPRARGRGAGRHARLVARLRDVRGGLRLGSAALFTAL